MTVLDDRQSLESKAKDHDSESCSLEWNEAPAPQNNERNGTWSYSEKPFLLRERNLLHLNMC